MSLIVRRTVWCSGPDAEILAALPFVREGAAPFGAQVGVAYSPRGRVLGYDVEVGFDLRGPDARALGAAAVIAGAEGELEAAVVAVRAVADTISDLAELS